MVSWEVKWGRDDVGRGWGRVGGMGPGGGGIGGFWHPAPFLILGPGLMYPLHPPLMGPALDAFSQTAAPSIFRDSRSL